MEFEEECPPGCTDWSGDFTNMCGYVDDNTKLRAPTPSAACLELLLFNLKSKKTLNLR